MLKRRKDKDNDKSIIKEFRSFVLRGNVVDLAVGVAMGAAFGGVVNSLVKDVFTPFLLGLFGSPNFSNLEVGFGRQTIGFHLLANTFVTFVLTAIGLFFLIVKPVNRLMERHKTQTEVEQVTRECPHCLSKIPQAASRCAFCTQAVDPVTPAVV